MAGNLGRGGKRPRDCHAAAFPRGCALTEEFSREILAWSGIHGDGVIDVPGELRVIAEGGQ